MPVHFGQFVLDADGLSARTGTTSSPRSAHEILGRLLRERGAWFGTGELARELYERDDSQGRMLVRRHVSLLRRALGDERWMIESALQRGYRIARSRMLESSRAPEA